MSLMTKQQVSARLAQPNGAEKLFDRAEDAFDAAYSLFAEDGSPSACAFLCRCAKQKRFAIQLNDLLGEARTPLRGALAGEDPKLRKNAARLAGALGDPADGEALISALKKETQRFARPSMILALGAVGGENAKAFLSSYAPKKPADASEARHYEEELTALADARKRMTTLPKHPFIGLDMPYEIELRTPKKLSGSLLFELEDEDIAPKAFTPDSVTVETDNIHSLLNCRSYAYPLFVLARGAALGAGSTAAMLHRKMKELLCACHEGQPPFGYRIEIKGETSDRAAVAKGLASMIDSTFLINAPSDYEAELLVEPDGRGNADFFLRLTTLPDTRFAYRVGALPASMHPATAAAVLRYAMEHMRVNARVLDPCCGSGTLLIERGKLAPTGSLTGVDIAHKAIDIARENAKAAQSSAKFVCNDMLRFQAERKYDEIIANLPFGNRVGSHKNNELLYAGLLDRLPQWLNKDGVAILYTMEFTLLKKLVREREFLRLVTETRTEAGGLLPGVFILKLKA